MSYVALVTGASSGIGEATARRLAAEPDTHVVVVARRAERLPGGPNITAITADLTDPEAPARIAAQLEREHGALHLLVNNAGARWSQPFAEGGWVNVERHMRINFEAPVRMVEALLPLMRRTAAAAGPVASSSAFAGRPLGAQVAIVNVSSTAGRVSRRDTGGYNASKFALIGWSDSLHLEERPHGIHVGLVLPGFVSTEGFPQAELLARPLTRLLVSDVEGVVDAILEAGPGGRPERYAPRYYGIFASLRVLTPGLVRAALDRGDLATNTRST